MIMCATPRRRARHGSVRLGSGGPANSRGDRAAKHARHSGVNRRTAGRVRPRSTPPPAVDSRGAFDLETVALDRLRPVRGSIILAAGMALIGLNRAARAAGVAKSTLLRHVEQGRVSAAVDAAGGRAFDTAELRRVYGELRDPESPPAPKATATKPVGGSHGPGTAEQGEALRRDIERLEAEIARLRADLDRERADRERWESRYDQLAARTLHRLPSPETATPPAARSTRPPALAEAAEWFAGEVRGFVDLIRGRPLNRP